jgi:hypothetical protein
VLAGEVKDMLGFKSPSVWGCWKAKRVILFRQNGRAKRRSRPG